MKRRSKPPVGSIEHDVVENETIEKIALKWNTTPSEILRMNRLATRTIFPGKCHFYVYFFLLNQYW